MRANLFIYFLVATVSLTGCTSTAPSHAKIKSQPKLSSQSTNQQRPTYAQIEETYVTHSSVGKQYIEPERRIIKSSTKNVPSRYLSSFQDFLISALVLCTVGAILDVDEGCLFPDEIIIYPYP